MFLTKEKDFLIREFSLADFPTLFTIANNINKQANHNKEFQPFYAFNTNITDEDYHEQLSIKTKNFLLRAINEKNKNPRSTHRLALCLPDNTLIGNVTIDTIPFIDETGKLTQGDIGYFINPEHGRHGLMSKAIEHVLSVYFMTHNQMDVTIHPDNIHSIKMMQKFNARITGVKQNSLYQGEPRLILSLSKKDFLSKQKPFLITRKTPIILTATNERGSYV